MEAPEYQSGFCTQFVTEKRHSIDNKATGGGGGGDHFMVEDLLDFSNEDDAVIADTPFEVATTTTAGNSTDSSTVTIVDSCNSSSFSGCDPNFVSDIGCRNFPDANFSSDLCVPYDDLAELEWLSNFVEESFSSEDLQKLQMISGMKARTVDETSETTPQHEPSNRNSNSPIFRPEMSVPAKARSKRSRAAPCNWTSRLLVLSQQSPSSSPPPPPQSPSLTPPYSDLDRDFAVAKKTVKVAAYSKKKDGVDSGGDGRKCLHCATDKTPQWRTGPMGPKTLCNACGVRYKSGRLVPEYRPAASPTFMLTKHSNSHRKVLELRRQKEMMRTHHHHHHHHHQQHQHHQHQHQQQQFLHHHHQNMVFDVTNGGDDYLIHSHVGPDFRQLI